MDVTRMFPQIMQELSTLLYASGCGTAERKYRTFKKMINIGGKKQTKKKVEVVDVKQANRAKSSLNKSKMLLN